MSFSTEDLSEKGASSTWRAFDDTRVPPEEEERVAFAAAALLSSPRDVPETFVIVSKHNLDVAGGILTRIISLIY